MNFGSLQLIFFAFIRFEAMKSIIDNNKDINEVKLPELRLRNRRSLLTGLCMAFGLAVASNFRDSEGPFVQTMHALGAYFLFVSSVFDLQCSWWYHFYLATHQHLTCIQLQLLMWTPGSSGTVVKTGIIFIWSLRSTNGYLFSI